MPGDYEVLKRTIEDGVRAAEQLQKMLAEQKREGRPRLRLIKGGLVGGAIALGVEWFGGYRRIVVALAATGITITGATIAERPHSPGADPPSQAIAEPAAPRSSVPPQPPPTRAVVPTPRRTSPPRIQPAPTRTTAARPKPLIVEPSTPAKTATPTAAPATKPTVTPSVPPPEKPTSTPSVPVTDATSTQDCTGIGLLGLCLLGS